MKKYQYNFKTQLQTCEEIINECGESIEQKVRRVTANNEPIESISPMIYTERKEGVRPECDPRTDRQEIACDTTDKITKSYVAAREERMKKVETPVTE